MSEVQAPEVVAAATQDNQSGENLPPPGKLP